MRRNVALLALTSLLADVSGEMLMAVLPFLLVAQGATGVGVGLVGGLSDAAGHALKPFAGRLADRMGKRRPLILVGYLTAAIARIGIALASAWPASLAFRSADRIGKGLRTAPRDALLAESVPGTHRGRAFGIHRAADTLGAVLGVSLALAALWRFGADLSTLQAVVLVGALIGLSTLLPLLFVQETDARAEAKLRLAEPASPRFGLYVALAGVFALGNVSYLFFVLRALGAARNEAGAVALYLLFNLVYVAAAYPFGRAADRYAKPRVLLVGWALFALASLLFVARPSLPLAIGGFVAMGLAFAGFESVQRALAADLAGSTARGARLGAFHATVGLCTVAGGLVAGLLWDGVGEWATFAWGASVALVATVLLAATLARPTA